MATEARAVVTAPAASHSMTTHDSAPSPETCFCSLPPVSEIPRSGAQSQSHPPLGWRLCRGHGPRAVAAEAFLLASRHVSTGAAHRGKHGGWPRHVGITQAGSTESEHKTERNRAAQTQTDKDINQKDQQNNMNRSNRTETHTERIIQKTQDEQSRTNTNRSGQEPKGNTEGHEQKNRADNETERNN